MTRALMTSRTGVCVGAVHEAAARRLGGTDEWASGALHASHTQRWRAPRRPPKADLRARAREERVATGDE